MSNETDLLLRTLKNAREAKGLSQRDLSARARVPQAHISKIESGAVDLRVSSLVALARVLDLELMLVPRKALSAVQSIVRSSEPLAALPVSSGKELQNLQRLIFSIPVQAQKPRELAQLSRLLRDLHRFPLVASQRAALKEAATSVKALEDTVATKDIEAIKSFINSEEGLRKIREGLARVQRLRNEVAHGIGTVRQEPARAAYSLDDDEAEDA